MQFTRFFSKGFLKPDTSVEKRISWKRANSKISKTDGTIIFEMLDIEVPTDWSQNAIDILAQKYFRKAGVGDNLAKVSEDNIPPWLQRSISNPDKVNFGPETSAKQVFHRLAGAWTYWGWKENIFKQTDADPLSAESYQAADHNAHIFYDELYLMLALQIAAPNSPQWFNTGLHWAYGISGPPSGQWAITPEGLPYETFNSYEFPQPHACFIQPVSDDLVNPSGLMDLWRKETLLFKQGSGTGTNFSKVRGLNEKLSGGGVSSGLMSFLETGDVNAKSIKSGGVTRRAAKMCVLDLDHPEILDFINWKSREEYKAACMNIGSRILAEMKTNETSKDLIPTSIQERINQGGFDTPVFDITWQGEAVTSVSGQNSNNSVRITDNFLNLLDNPHNPENSWALTNRTDGEVNKVISSKDLWHQLCRAAWASGDPGVQFEDTINTWHTCKNDGRINASNPCSEYLFLDNTACNLASLNLVKFLRLHGKIDTEALTHATRLWTTVLEISVFMAAFPSKEIAEGSYNYRTLGLGFSNLGSLLMRKALPYDSDDARNLATSLTAIIHGQALLTSIEMGKELGPFPRWKANKDSCDEILKKHIYVFENTLYNDRYLWKTATNIYQELEKEVQNGHGPRNAQVTNIAPTGTISFVMDCDTTGIEPSIQLISFKSLAGGGDLVLGNEAVAHGLKALSYTPAQILSILQHIKENGTIEGWKLNGRDLPEDHLKVFDCANPGNGKRFIPYQAHLKMVAAVQQFISGGISKTINLPNHATIEDVSEAYLLAHKLGVKSVALYRDGSKLDQPLKAKQAPTPTPTKTFKFEDTITQDGIQHFGFDPEPSLETVRNWLIPPAAKLNGKLKNGHDKNGYDKTLPRGQRDQLPASHPAHIQKVRIDGHALYLIEGIHPETKQLGEIYLELSKEGSTTRALLNSIAKAVSIGLQYGVPIERYVKSFVYTRFEPAGIVEGHNHIKLASSILDFVFRHIAVKYLSQHEFADNKEDLEKDLTFSYQIASTSNNLQINISGGGESTHAIAQNIPINTPVATPIAIASTLEECPNCHSLKLIRTGTCTFCTNCKENSGCG